MRTWMRQKSERCAAQIGLLQAIDRTDAGEH
jgi:hypothetical protein